MTSLFCKGTKGWVTCLGLHRKPVMHPGANVPMSAGTGTATGCTGFWGRIWTQTCTSLLPPGPPGMCPPMLCSKCRASQARLSQVNLCDELLRCLWVQNAAFPACLSRGGAGFSQPWVQKSWLCLRLWLFWHCSITGLIQPIV